MTKLHDLNAKTTLSDVITTGGKPKSGKDPLADLRKCLNAVKNRSRTSTAQHARGYLAGVKEELVPAVVEAAEQAADLLGDEQLGYLKEHYDELMQTVVRLVVETRSKSAQAGDDLAFAYLNHAWKLAPKSTQSVAYLVADAVNLGICHVDKKTNGIVLSYRDRETGRIGGATVSFTRHPSFSATLKEMRNVQENWWADRNAQQKDAEQAIWDEADSNDLLSALQSETPVKVAFRVPRGKGGGCRVALCLISCGYIKPLKAEGDRVAWFFKKGNEQGVVLPIGSLTQSRLSLPCRLDQNSFKTAINLHRLLQRAVEGAKKKAMMEISTKEFRAQDTLTLKEWFESDKTGTCTLSERSWFYQNSNKEKVYLHNVFLRLRREKDGNIFVEDFCDEGDGRKFVALDNRIQQATPQDEVLYPLSAFLKKANGRWSTKKEREATVDADNQAAERAAEAERELEAQREAVAKAEAKRIADQQTNQTK